MALKGEPFKKLFGVLKGVAPTALAALGGPYGALAAGVMRKVLKVEGSTDSDLEAAVMAAAGDPAAVSKLKEIEVEMQAQETALQIRFAELETSDRDSARNRQIALKDSMPAQVFYLTSLGFFGALVFMFVRGIPATGGDALLLMLGSLGTAWGASVAYFVGSSAGSKQKTELIGK